MKDRLRAIADKMSVGVLAQKSGIGVRTLQTYLSGRSNPSADKLAAIISASGEDANWVLFGGEHKTAGEVDSVINESLFLSIFDEVHTVDSANSVKRTLLRSDLSHAIRVYNQAVSLPGKSDLRASLILTQEEKTMICRLINNESAQAAETPEEQTFVKKQVQRYETRLSDLDEKEALLIREIGPDYKV